MKFSTSLKQLVLNLIPVTVCFCWFTEGKSWRLPDLSVRSSQYQYFRHTFSKSPAVNPSNSKSQSFSICFTNFVSNLSSGPHDTASCTRVYQTRAGFPRPSMSACIQFQCNTAPQYPQSLCGASSSLLSVFLLLSLLHPYFCLSSCSSMRPLPSVWFCIHTPWNCPESLRYQCQSLQTAIHMALKVIQV